MGGLAGKAGKGLPKVLWRSQPVTKREGKTGSRAPGLRGRYPGKIPLPQRERRPQNMIGSTNFTRVLVSVGLGTQVKLFRNTIEDRRDCGSFIFPGSRLYYPKNLSACLQTETGPGDGGMEGTRLESHKEKKP